MPIGSGSGRRPLASRSRWRRRLRVTALVAGAAFLLDLVVAIAGLAVSLQGVRASGAELRSLDPTDTDLAALRELRADAGRAAWFARHPALRVVAAVSPDLGAGALLARAAADISGPAVGLVDALSGEGSEGLLVDGRVDLERVHRAGGYAGALERQVRGWRRRLADADLPWSGTLRGALHDVTEDLASLEPTATNVASALRVLPSVLGGSGARTYLVTFQSPSEARGGGGLVGVVAELRARSGVLELGKIRSVRALVRGMHGSVRAPAWFEAAYGPLLALTDPRNANVSPNFPATSQVLLRMYRRAVGVDADGMLSTDPLALGALTEVTGPVQARGWRVAITEDNVRRVLLHDVYRHFHLREHLQNRYFGNLIGSLWTKLTSGVVDPFELVPPLARSAARQHLKIYLENPAQQQTIARLGAEGAFADERGPQLVFSNNLAANKIDFFLHREVTTDVRLRIDGSALVRTSILLENRIDDLERNVIARPGVQRSLALGLNRTSLSVLMPPGSEAVAMSVDGRVLTPRDGLDAGHPTASTFVDVPAGDRARVTIVYRWPGAVADGRFRMTLMPQATARPDRVRVRILGPDGAALLERAEALKEPMRIDLPAT